MKPEHIAQWKATRAKGMLRYVLLQGVLAWGIPMFVVMTFVVNPERSKDALLVGLQAVIWMIGGAVFGTGMWFVSERNYRKATGGDTA